MNDYVAPQLTRVGSITEMTMGNLFSPGQDSLSWIPIIGGFFGS